MCFTQSKGLVHEQFRQYVELIYFKNKITSISKESIRMQMESHFITRDILKSVLDSTSDNGVSPYEYLSLDEMRPVHFAVLVLALI